MSAADPISEAERVLRICSACMYCDGLCPVFPAIDGKVNAFRQQSYANFGGGSAVTIPAYTITTAAVQVSYSIDLWGGARRDQPVAKVRAGVGAREPARDLAIDEGHRLAGELAHVGPRVAEARLAALRELERAGLATTTLRDLRFARTPRVANAARSAGTERITFTNLLGSTLYSERILRTVTISSLSASRSATACAFSNPDTTDQGSIIKKSEDNCFQISSVTNGM